jgi:hypothetical protein
VKGYLAPGTNECRTIKNKFHVLRTYIIKAVITHIYLKYEFGFMSFIIYDFRPREKSFVLYMKYTDALLALKYCRHAIRSFLKGNEGCCTVHVGRMERTFN